MVDDLRISFRRRLATAVVVGMLAFGAPPPRSAPLRTPPALVRVHVGPGAGAEAFRSFFEPLRGELN